MVEEFQGVTNAWHSSIATMDKGASMSVGGRKSKDCRGGMVVGDAGCGRDDKKADDKVGMMTALVDTNVQVNNNSLLLQSSCSGADLGMHSSPLTPPARTSRRMPRR